MGRSDRIIVDDIYYVKIKRWRIIHMAGWQLSEGGLEKENISQDEFWTILKRVFSNKSKNTTSYKYCFFKSLLDNLFNCDSNYSLTFEQIFETSAEIYWNLVFKYGINQAIQSKQWGKSKIERIIEQIVADYGILESTPYEFICEDAKITMHKKVRTELRKYVIGAFYEDTKGMFYAFSKRDSKVTLHGDVYEYLIEHKYLVEKLNYYEWLRFLEKINPIEQSYALGDKLDESTKRVSLKKYKEFLYTNFGQHECFYCKKKLNEKVVEVDHFIPWSYMKSDQLWNFVLSCKKCNGSKRDKLPNYKFIQLLIDRNREILVYHNDNLVKGEFKNYNEFKLKRIFNAACQNGLDTNWGA